LWRTTHRQAPQHRRFTPTGASSRARVEPWPPSTPFRHYRQGGRLLFGLFRREPRFSSYSSSSLVPRSSCVERHRRVGSPTSSFSSSLISLRIIPIWLSRALNPPLPIRFAGRGAARVFCPLFGGHEPSSSFLAPDFRPEGHRIYAYRDTPDLHPTIDR
jgi:hypothetical protein